MYTSLNARMLRVTTMSFEETVAAAKELGFGGVELDQATLLDHEPAELTQQLSAAGLRAGGWSVPFDFTADTPTYEAGLRDLAGLAARAAAVGATRCIRWIRPWSDDRDWDENWRFHVERLTGVAAVLAEHGCRLGLEYVGPATSRRGHRYPFVHSQADALSLSREIGHGTGLLVDSWHWYTSHGTAADLARLTNDDIVLVHVNDAPAGIAVDEQVDNQRLLPAASGVIDIASFMTALRELDYDGPVVVEPFDESLDQLEPRERLRAAATGLAKIMRPT